MNKVKNFFDDFTFHARVMPIMVYRKVYCREDGLKTSALFY